MKLGSLKKHFSSKIVGVTAFVSVAALAQQTIIPEFVEKEKAPTAAVVQKRSKPIAAVQKVPAVKKKASLFLHIEPSYIISTDYFSVYSAFCNEFASECGGQGYASAIVWSDEVKELLSNVNLGVNASVEFAYDKDLYNDPAKFAIPQSINGEPLRGDCEDYALLKRRILREHGIPMETMMIGILNTEKGELHNVLVVRTMGGDYVLDNRSSEIKLARDTGYTYRLMSLPSNDRLISHVLQMDESKDTALLNTYGARSVTISGTIPSAEDVRLSLVPPEEVIVLAQAPSPQPAASSAAVPTPAPTLLR